MAMTQEERRRRDREAKRRKYATDPEYRARKQAQNRAYAATHRQDHAYDPERSAAYHAERQANDPEYRKRRRAASLKWKQEHALRIKALISAAKDRPCVDCGKQYHPCCMEFDHVRGQKHFNLSKAATNTRTIEDVHAEIAKCEVRCVMCHRLRHFGVGRFALVD